MTDFNVQGAIRAHAANVTDAEQVARELRGLIQHHEREIDVHTNAIATLRKSVLLVEVAADAIRAQMQRLKASLPADSPANRT